MLFCLGTALKLHLSSDQALLGLFGMSASTFYTIKCDTDENLKCKEHELVNTDGNSLIKVARELYSVILNNSHSGVCRVNGRESHLRSIIKKNSTAQT